MECAAAKAKNPNDESQGKETLNGENENRVAFKSSVATPGKQKKASER